MTAVPEIARRLVGGRWKNTVANEGANGGSQPVTVAPVRVVSTSAADMTNSPPSGAATIDVYTAQDGDRVLLLAQTTSDDNGVWVVSTGGTWTRPADFASGATIPGGTLVAVDSGSGTFLGGSVWLLNGDLVVDGGTAHTWTMVAAETAVAINAQAGDYPQIFLGTGQVGAQGDASFSTNGKLGFYETTPIVQQTGVAVSAAAIHAALVNLGLITA